MEWVFIHWFDLGTLALLCFNLWFVSGETPGPTNPILITDDPQLI